MIPLYRPNLNGNEQDYAAAAIASGQIGTGPFIDRFEREFGGIFGMPALSCSSGAAALHLAMLAAGVEPGDEVIVPDVTFAAPANVALRCGARPVLVDIDENMQLDPAGVIGALRPETVAVVAVHLYGWQPDMLALRDICRSRNIVLIEDAAEACYPFVPRGDLVCFSFHGNKAIATGEGGAVLCDDPAKLELLRLYRSHGQVGQWRHRVAGLNYRMSNLTAAIGCAQLEHYHQDCSRRAEVVRALHCGIPDLRGNWLAVVPRRRMTVCETRSIFDPLHMQQLYAIHNPIPYQGFAHSVDLFQNYMAIPCGPHLSDADVGAIIAEHQLARAA